MNFEYTKDDGEVSKRFLHGLTTPNTPHPQALDLTDTPEEKHAQAIAIHNEWKDMYKEYQKKERAFKKENLPTVEALFEERGWAGKPPLIKSFKAAGLKPIE